MKYPVTRFKSMKIALKEIESFIRNGLLLQNGKPLKKFGGMLPREVVANWLLCACLSALENLELIFCSDATGGDGIIQDNITGRTWSTEHIFVPKQSLTSGIRAEQLILQAIDKKQKKGGLAYASGKILIVFLGIEGGEWFPNTVARKLPNPLLFNQVWVITLHIVKDGEYEYGVTLLDVSGGNTPIYRLRINKDFNSWDVRRTQ